MDCHQCSIVPPYLLTSIAENHKDEPAGQAAIKTLAHIRKIHQDREEHFQNKAHQHHSGQVALSGQSIVPQYLLQQISTAPDVSDEVKQSARDTLAVTQQIQDARVGASVATGPAPAAVPTWRGVYDMKNKDITDALGNKQLPGVQARVELGPAVSDKVVNEAYDNAGRVLDFYKKVFNWNSVDGQGMPVISSVHVGQGYGNASWQPKYQQMVYGDGDGFFLWNFTACLDVIGHEITHGVTEKTSHLFYGGESGALNEHISDAFGSMVRQYTEQKKSRDADWLVGELCLFPGVKGVALRNMRNPGTAYNNPENSKIGKDPQPVDVKGMKAYMQANPIQTFLDNGGVHLFSGVPNRAFVIIAEAFDGFSWEKAGKIWWTVVTTNKIPADCTFIQFADATVDVANTLFGTDAATIVRNAWNTVGVVRAI